MKPRRLTHLKVVLLLVTVIAVGSCFNTSKTPPSPTVGSNPAEVGEFMVDACKNLAGSTDACYWRYQYDTSRCTVGNPCSKLVIFFSGGDMTCDESFTDSSAGYSKMLKSYAEDGYLAVCAGLFVVNTEAQVSPFHAEWERVNTIITKIRESDVTKALWDGSHLLFAGISHGATAPVAAMATTHYDASEAWQGTKTTAACFHDGLYDPMYLNTFLKTYPISCGYVRNATICPRYVGGSDCADPNPTSTNILLDTTATVNPTNFNIKNWKLIECGSGLPLPPCGNLLAVSGSDLSAIDRDWLPAQPIQDLCTNIDGSSTHQCTYDSLPNEGHLSCHGTTSGIAKCRDWFNSQLN